MQRMELCSVVLFSCMLFINICNIKRNFYGTYYTCSIHSQIIHMSSFTDTDPIVVGVEEPQISHLHSQNSSNPKEFKFVVLHLTRTS